ncbi:fused response regulator/phosphatase [Catellatospora sp. KI3]|uniref:fused response regulator/phosphatase n=1 Tax=Catellatospora sp. KI3 TaxID=3041620 RepID=UPI002482E73F|nr:fused response regulator/phosphatase [Catellatospora sp. KI3]MDI1463266.1 fused response regulator/phosphatase [Catellatospora sp. KI3]
MTAITESTILVVDDSAPKRYLLSNWLSRAGFAVSQAETGHEALAQIEARDFDMVVLDVKLPDMSGLEVCRRIKADERTATIPVVHVSAHAVDVTDRTIGLVGGADAYLAEPIDPQELVATVQAVLRYYRALRKAEHLAAGLAQLARTTLAVTTANGFGELLTHAAAGAARLFGGTAVVAADVLDGTWSAVRVDDTGRTDRRDWTPPADDAPIGFRCQSGHADHWRLPAGWLDDQPLTVASARLRDDLPPLYLFVAQIPDEDSTQLLTQLTQALGAAAEAQRAQDLDHRIAVTLQRSLLPRSLPALPGVELAMRYEPASTEAEIGGDFYELSLLDDRLLIAIGDVVGHSLHAATVMAEIRHALRAYAVEGHPPGAIVQLVDELMVRLLPVEMATLCVISIDAATGRARLANAGHLPPLLITDGQASELWQRAPLLGIGHPRPADLEFTLPPGSTLLLYTDGLIEHRGTSIRDGIATLHQLARHVDADLDAFCDRLLDRLTTPPNADDVAVVAVRRM